MTEIARIVNHPHDRDVVLIHTPPALKSELGRFEPARYAPDHRAYLVHHDHIGAFYRFARTISLHVVDERTKAAGQRTLPRECANCSQPASVVNPPKMCPACGQQYIPTPPPVREPKWRTAECASCKHRQPGRFCFCSNCGAPMTDDPPPAPRPVIVDNPRTRLVDPMSLESAMDAANIAPIRPLKGPETIGGRPVETKDLLGSGDDNEGEPSW